MVFLVVNLSRKLTSFVWTKYIFIANMWQLKSMNEDYKNMFNQISIAEYNPNDVDNKYIMSKCNEYTYKINTIIKYGAWLLGEDKK